MLHDARIGMPIFRFFASLYVEEALLFSAQNSTSVQELE